MAYKFSFGPEDRYAEYHERKKKRLFAKKEKESFSWKAPEHQKLTSDMVRDFPRDDLGVPLYGSKRDILVLDNRPNIMRPQRETYLGFM